MPEIKVPAALTGGSASTVVDVEGATLREALDNHAAAHGPELRDSVVEDGAIREYINVFVNGEEVGGLDGLDTGIGPDDRIRVVPAASGGRQPAAR
jgi:molybdopterin synthase sulfur carrier subunit